MSKKITLSADGNTATVGNASISDIFTTAFSGDACVTGTYGFLQKGLLFVGGMATQNYRLGRGWNPLGPAA